VLALGPSFCSKNTRDLTVSMYIIAMKQTGILILVSYKNGTSKRTGVIAQLVECFLSKHKALNSIPSTAKMFDLVAHACNPSYLGG
jgi:hypothetical protein